MRKPCLKGIKTIQQIAKEFYVHPVQVSDWRKKLSTQAGSLFECGASKNRNTEDFSAKRAQLHSKIGEFTVKLDFEVKKSKQLGVLDGLPNSLCHSTRN